MRNKTWVIAASISTGWLFITSLIYIVCGMSIKALNQIKVQEEIYDSTLYNILFVMSLGCLIAGPTLFVWIQKIIKKSDKLDRLDEEIQKYKDAKAKLINKINNL
jgi:hypothetical protein